MSGKMLLSRLVFRPRFRSYSTINTTQILEKLANRSLLRVSGNDAGNLLQGVITNDILHLSHGPGSMYAMFLNNKGRVLYDTIVYRIPAENTYYVEVDSQVVDLVKKHLTVFRLRKKVDISRIDDQIHVWAYFQPTIQKELKSNNELTKLEGKIVPCTVLSENWSDNNVIIKPVDNQEALVYRDPRLNLLGSRILAPANSDTQIEEIFSNTKSQPVYKWFRYKLGIGEGINEFPPGNCFPLEANCDYLHGVSFHKGCYIGQELTARSHHTGVVRKRLMPLFLSDTFKKPPGKDEIIKLGDKNVGKLRGYEEDSALALLRIAEVLNKTIIVNGVEATTAKPDWWPVELSKEKVSIGKN